MNKYLEKIAATYKVEAGHESARLSEEEHGKYKKEYAKNPGHVRAVGKALVGGTVGGLIGAGIGNVSPRGRAAGSVVGDAIGTVVGWKSSKKNSRLAAISKATSKKDQD